jgi:methionine sulfoxide reductase heme-binding subunit
MGSRNAGKAVVACCTGVLLAMCTLLLLRHGAGEDGWRVVIRATARTSLVLFTAAYVASSLRALRRGAATKWLLANRRSVGLSYAVSHTLHLGAIGALSRVAADFEPATMTVVFGGIAYVFLYAMALTSSDRAVVAMGTANWRRLHRAGMHYNWFIFAQSYLRRGFAEPGLYSALAAIVVGGAAIRVAAYARARSA